MKKPVVQKDRPLGLYIHIPFCQAKCAYCDFYSLAHSEKKMDAYVSALSQHLLEVAPQAALHLVDTVYFGGGTPSYLGAHRLTELLKIIRKHYRLSKDAEITLEANPDSAGDWRALRALRRAGFNRISLGVQAMDDGLLQRIGRIHTVQQVRQAVEAARRAKLANLSLDLIYGLPGQTMEQWQQTLSDAVALAPEHLSCYGLKVEEGTPLWQEKPADLPDDDLQADMYLYTVQFLQEHGYQQYEISNFAKPGYASRHNLKYWTLQEYAGFGPGAYSDFGDVRYGYVRDLDSYLQGKLLLAETERLDPLDRDMEYIMLRMRTTLGVDGKAFEYRFRQRFTPLAQQLQQYEQMGLAQQEGTVWRLTPRGFLLSNQVIGQLQEILSQEKITRMNRAARGDYRIVE